MEHWHTIKLDKSSSPDVIQAYVDLSPESPWFSGHFPNEPILPGFAVMSMVFDMIRLTVKEALILNAFKKVRFKKVMGPGDRLKIKAVKQSNDLTYAFTVHANDIHACKGTIILNVFQKS